MSDTEGTKKTGYRLDYASSGRSKCKGPKPCNGTAIGKGELRFGSLVDFRGNTSFAYRHWGCVTSKILSNMKNSFDEAEELDGFEDLNDEDQERVKKAWAEGHVAPEDIPESARKADGEASEEEEEDKPKKKAGKKKEEEDTGVSVFKFEYASSGRSKCKDCSENIGKDYFRFGQEVDFRGNKSYGWRHWGCADAKLVERLKASYEEPAKVPGWDDLKDGEKEKVQRAWEEGAIPADDKGVGEPVDTGKKKAAPRKKKDADGEAKPKKPRAPRKKKVEDEDDEMDEDDEEEEEKPKKAKAKAAPKAKAAAKAKPAPKKAAAKKKKEESESGEDFNDELAAVDEEEIDEEDEEEPEENSKKRKRAPASKGAAKPPSKRAKPASSAKPPSKAKPASSRGKKKAEEPIEEADEDDYD